MYPHSVTKLLGVLRHKVLQWPNAVKLLSSRACSSGPQLTISPSDTALVDDEVAICVSGLNRNQAVTIYASLTEKTDTFHSCGCYYADDRGTVDVSRRPAVAGSYSGVSAMGLFWSMAIAPGQRSGIRLMKRDITTPFVTDFSVFDGHHTSDELHAGHHKPISKAVCKRWYQAPGVRRIPVKAGRLRGALFLPPGQGPFPGVIDMFGTAGGLAEYRAALLASRGFAAFALAYFAYEDLPTDILNIDLDYFLEAVDWLSVHPDIVPGGVGAIGVSKGAEIAILLAKYSNKVKAVVNISGPPFLSSIKLHYSKEDLNFVELELDKVRFSEEGSFISRDCLTAHEEDMFQTGTSDAKILNIVGEDDQMWDIEKYLFKFRDMYPEDKRSNCEVVLYPGAGHLIEPPYTPLCRMSYHKAVKFNLLWGGETAAHAAAQEDSWSRILRHLRTHLPQQAASSATMPASKL